MKPRATLVLVWFTAGIGAVGVSIATAWAGNAMLFAGAVVGGALGAMLGVWLCERLGWLARVQRGAATVGAVIGFLVAAPIAALNLHTPITPILICSLAGLGALVGAGRASRS